MAARSAMAGTLIRETTALDPETGQPCPARVVERDGKVFLEKTLAPGRTQSVQVEADAGFYRRFARPDVCGRHVIMNHFLYVTSRCNLKCPVCYESRRAVEEPTLESLQRTVAGLRRARVLLCGAEPTCRDDLPELIRDINRENGVVLMTNGLRLADKKYLRRLFDAGLDHVILSMNGLTDDVYRRINGSAQLTDKLRALENMNELGVRVFLSATITRGVNEDQIGPLLDLEKRMPCVLQVRLRSMAEVGGHLKGGQFFMSEFTRLVCRQAGIDLERWLRHQDFLEQVGRLLRLDRIRPRLCAMRADLTTDLVPMASDRDWRRGDGTPAQKARLVAALLSEWGASYLSREFLGRRRKYRYTRHPGIRRIALRVWPTLNTLDVELNRRCTSLYYRDGKVEPFCLCNIRENL